MTYTQLAFISDSPLRGVIANCDYGLGGQGSCTQLAVDRLANIVGLGPLVSSGFIPCGAVSGGWTFSGTLDGGGASDWVSTLSTDAWDKHPYGVSGSTALLKYGSGASKVATFTASANLRFPNQGFTLYLVDYTSAGTASYSTDGGSVWTNIPDAPQNGNKIYKFHVATPITSSGTVKVRCANSAGTAQGCAPLGIEVFYQDPATASGFTGHMISVGGTDLHDLVATTSGDRFAWWKSAQIRLGTNAISHLPSVTVLENVNDVKDVNNTTTWTTDVGKFNTALGPLGSTGVINLYEVNTSTYNQTSQTNYRAQTVTSAAGFSPAWKVLDIYAQWAALGITGNTQANTQGWLADLVHESQAGHLNIATRLYDWLRLNFFSSFTGPSLYVASGKQAATPGAQGKVAAVPGITAGPPIAVVPV